MPPIIDKPPFDRLMACAASVSVMVSESLDDPITLIIPLRR